MEIRPVTSPSGPGGAFIRFIGRRLLKENQQGRVVGVEGGGGRLGFSVFPLKLVRERRGGVQWKRTVLGGGGRGSASQYWTRFKNIQRQILAWIHSFEPFILFVDSIRPFAEMMQFVDSSR